MKANNFYQDYVKRIKKTAREDYGFQPERIAKNHKKYNRSSEKRVTREMVYQSW